MMGVRQRASTGETKALAKSVVRLALLEASRRLSPDPAVRRLTSCVVRLALQGAARRDMAASFTEALGEMEQIRATLQRLEAAASHRAARVDAAAAKLQAAERGRQTRRSIAGQHHKARVLQSMAREWMQRKLACRRPDFAGTVQLVRMRHAAWSSVFDGARGMNWGLQRASLALALQQLRLTVSEAQVDALWQGFEEGTGASAMDSRTFCSLLTALSEGPRAAAEFADVSAAVWGSLGGKGQHPENLLDEESASRVIQRHARSRLERRASQSEAVGHGLIEVGFSSALGQACPKLSSAQISALWTGFRAGTGRDVMDPRTFDIVVEAVADGGTAVAELADLASEEFEALGTHHQEVGDMHRLSTV